MIDKISIKRTSHTPTHIAGLIVEQLFKEMLEQVSTKEFYRKYPKYNYFNDLLIDYTSVITLLKERTKHSQPFSFSWEYDSLATTAFNTVWWGGNRWHISYDPKEEVITFTQTHNEKGEINDN